MGPADLADPECIMHQSMAGADFTTIHKTVHVSDRRRGLMGRHIPS